MWSQQRRRPLNLGLPAHKAWIIISQVNTDRSQLDHELFIALLTRRKGEWGFPSAKKSPLGPCGASFVCRWLGVATSEHKQFALTHKDTFSHSHLTKQPTGNRTDTSLSALRSEIAAPAVIKPGSHFLPFSAVWIPRKGFWVKTQAPPPHPLHAPPHRPPLLQAAGSQRSHFLLGESECRSGAGWGGRKVALSSPSEAPRRARPPCYHPWTRFVVSRRELATL